MPKYTTEEILNLSLDEFAQLDKRTMVDMINKLNSIANKRVRRAIASGWANYSPAVQSAVNYGGREKPFSTEDIYKNKGGDYKLSSIKKQFGRVQCFLKLKTSSYQGALKLKEATEKRLGGRFRSEDLKNRFWQLYNRFLEDQGKAVVSGANSTQVQRYLYRITSGQTRFKEFNNEKLDILDEENEQFIYDKLERFGRKTYESQQRGKDEGKFTKI